jgi:hypothetical protein
MDMLIRTHACNRMGSLKQGYKELSWTDQNMKWLKKNVSVFLVGSGAVASCPQRGKTLNIASF